MYTLSPKKATLCRQPTRPKTLLVGSSPAVDQHKTFFKNESGAEDRSLGPEGGRVSALAKEKSKLAGVKLRLPSFRDQNEEALFETLLGFIRTRGIQQKLQVPREVIQQ